MRIKLLIVEDDDAQREEYRLALEEMGYAVTCAASAEQAVALADAADFAAILTDNVLPGMTGLRAIPEFRRKSRAPIMLMTSDAGPDLKKDALLLGAVALFQKPLDFQVVRLALAAVVAA